MRQEHWWRAVSTRPQGKSDVRTNGPLTDAELSQVAGGTGDPIKTIKGIGENSETQLKATPILF